MDYDPDITRKSIFEVKKGKGAKTNHVLWAACRENQTSGRDWLRCFNLKHPKTNSQKNLLSDQSIRLGFLSKRLCALLKSILRGFELQGMKKGGGWSPTVRKSTVSTLLCGLKWIKTNRNKVKKLSTKWIMRQSCLLS